MNAKASISASWLPMLAVLLGGLFSASAEHWPQWRGPSGTGVSRETQLPLRWGTNENVAWKTPLPDRGNSTPIIWGDRVFLTQSREKQQRHALLCLDRKNGRVLWERELTETGKEATHETNPPGSSSPVTDGERVVSWFGSAGVICHDFEGKELWRRQLGRQHHIWGWGASPVLVDNFCILNFGPGEPSFLVALDKRTGDERWRVTVPDADSGEKKPGQEKAVWSGSWSTPIVIRAEHQDQLILTWPREVVALDIPSGKKLWSCAGLNPLVYTSPLYDPPSRTIVAMGGFNGMALAVKAGGSNDVTATHRLWHHPKTRQRMGSGVIHEGHVYIHNDPGIAECWELATGKLVWEERLRGPAAKGDNWSSMILADGKLYTVNQGGDSFVLRASPKLEILATNSVAEPTIASMAVSDGQILIRTYRHLWCFGQRSATP